MTQNIEDCSIQISKNNSYRYLRTILYYQIILNYSYPANLFRQLHAVLPLSHKVSFRIHNRGKLVVRLIMRMGDEILFMTISVNLNRNFIYSLNFF